MQNSVTIRYVDNNIVIQLFMVSVGVTVLILQLKVRQQTNIRNLQLKNIVNQQFCLLPISRRITTCFSLNSPSYLASVGSRIIGSMSFINGQNPRMSEYIPYSSFWVWVKCFLFFPFACNSRCHCFLPLSSTLMRIYSTLSLSIHPLRGIQVYSRFWLLQIMLL